MGFFPKKTVMFACASILSILALSDVEARPIRKAPCLDCGSKPSCSIPLKNETDAASILPTKEAKKCHGKRHRRGCDEPRTIRRVPITITRSGKYCVTRDLTYTGTGAAITVEADNVTINFANHSLFLTDPAAEGVLAVDVEEFTLLNDKISLNQISNVTTSNAVHLIAVSKARIDNIFTENTLRGIRIEDSNDVNITNTHHKNHVGGSDAVDPPLSGSGIDIRSSSGVTVDNSFFEGSSGANHFQTGSINVNASRNINLTNTKHTEVDDAVFIANGSSGVLVDNLVATFSSEAFYLGIGIGASNDTETSNDIIIRNSTLTNLNALEGWDGFSVYFADGLIFENIIIDTNTSIASDYTPAALHFGCATFNACDEPVLALNGLFTNIVINNNNDFGLLVEGGQDLVFDNIEVTGSNVTNVYFQTSIRNILKNSFVGESSVGDGIVVSGDAESNALLNNIVTGSSTGITIATGANLTRVEENHVFGNFTFGIQNGDASTQTYYNRSCGNGPGPSTNCAGVFPSLNPGDPSEVGENICCEVEPG